MAFKGSPPHENGNFTVIKLPMAIHSVSQSFFSESLHVLCVCSGLSRSAHPTYSARTSPNACFPGRLGQALVRNSCLPPVTVTCVPVSPPSPERMLLEEGNVLEGRAQGSGVSRRDTAPPTAAPWPCPNKPLHKSGHFPCSLGTGGQ